MADRAQLPSPLISRELLLSDIYVAVMIAVAHG